MPNTWVPKAIDDQANALSLAKESQPWFDDIDQARQQLEQQAAPPPVVPTPEPPQGPVYNLPSFEELTGSQPTAAAKPDPQTIYQLPSFDELAAGPAASAPATAVAPSVKGPVQTTGRQAFIHSALPYAQEAERKYGIPASFTLALAVNEHGGEGRYMPGKNNYFGIQATDGQDGTPYKDWRPGPNGEQVFYNASARNFANDQEAFDSFARTIAEDPRYAKALAAYRQNGDLEGFVRGVHAGGYAEDPQWSNKVTALAREMPSSGSIAAPGWKPPAQTVAAGELTPNQFKSGLSDADAYAACGPAAAIAFARRTGRNPTMDEALQLAKRVGWTAENGMAGPQSQVKMLQDMGIASTLHNGVDWSLVKQDVTSGNPVILSTPGHYFVAERYDANSGKFDFGNSAMVLKASGGKRWFSPDEIASLGMGSPTASIFMDDPGSPSPSIANSASGPSYTPPTTPSLARYDPTNPANKAQGQNDRDSINLKLGEAFRNLADLFNPVTESVGRNTIDNARVGQRAQDQFMTDNDLPTAQQIGQNARMGLDQLGNAISGVLGQAGDAASQVGQAKDALVQGAGDALTAARKATGVTPRDYGVDENGDRVNPLYGQLLDVQNMVTGARSAIEQRRNDPSIPVTHKKADGLADFLLETINREFEAVKGARELGLQQAGEDPFEILGRGEVPAGVLQGLTIANLVQPEWAFAFDSAQTALTRMGMSEEDAGRALLYGGLIPMLKHAVSFAGSRTLGPAQERGFAQWMRQAFPNATQRDWDTAMAVFKGGDTKSAARSALAGSNERPRSGQTYRSESGQPTYDSDPGARSPFASDRAPEPSAFASDSEPPRAQPEITTEITPEPLQTALRRGVGGASEDTISHPVEETPDVGQGRPEQMRDRPNQTIQAQADEYVRRSGLREGLPETAPVKADPETQSRIAQAYDAMPNEITPDVREAYAQFAKEVDDQYNYLTKEKGVVFEPFGAKGMPFEGSDPYQEDAKRLNARFGKGYTSPSKLVAADAARGHLWVYAGENDHPLLSPHGTPWNESSNWKFRAVHDYFGHAAEGNNFAAGGEERAWLAHSKMFSAKARLAMTTETRGQNSWVNFGPYRDLPVTERPFAEQKPGILPGAFQTRSEAFTQPVLSRIMASADQVQNLPEGSGVRDVERVAPEIVAAARVAGTRIDEFSISRGQWAEAGDLTGEQSFNLVTHGNRQAAEWLGATIGESGNQWQVLVAHISTSGEHPVTTIKLGKLGTDIDAALTEAANALGADQGWNMVYTPGGTASEMFLAGYKSGQPTIPDWEHAARMDDVRAILQRHGVEVTALEHARADITDLRRGDYQEVIRRGPGVQEQAGGRDLPRYDTTLDRGRSSAGPADLGRSDGSPAAGDRRALADLRDPQPQGTDADLSSDSFGRYWDPRAVRHDLPPNAVERGGLARGSQQGLPGTPERAVFDGLQAKARAQGTTMPSVSSEEMFALNPKYMPGANDTGLRGVATSLDDLRYAADAGMPYSQWYQHFAQLGSRLVGEPNFKEFRTLFGIASEQASPDANAIWALELMRLRREMERDGMEFTPERRQRNIDFLTNQIVGIEAGTKIDPKTGKEKTIWDKSETLTYPTETKSDNHWSFNRVQIGKVVDAYTEGRAVVPTNAKTTTYSGNVTSALFNDFDPGSTIDTWAYRAQGYFDKNAPPNNLNAYRSTHAINAWLAAERGINVPDMQAAVWAATKATFDNNRDLLRRYQSTGPNRITLGEAVREAQRRGSFDNVTGQIDSVENHPGVRMAMEKLGPLLDKSAPLDERTAEMHLFHPGGDTEVKNPKIPRRPWGPEAVAQGRAYAEGVDPSLSLPVDERGSRVPGLESVPHRVVSTDGHTDIYLPGANASTAEYAAAVAGRHYGVQQVGLHLPSSEAPTAIGLRVANPDGSPLTPEQVSTLSRAAGSADLFVTPDRSSVQLALPPGGDANDFYRTAVSVQRAARDAGLGDGALGGYAGDFRYVGSDDFDRLIQAHRDTYGPERRPSLSSGGSTQSAAGFGLGLAADSQNPDNYDEQGNYKPDLGRTLGTAALAGGMVHHASPGFFSQLRRTVEAKIPNRVSAAQLYGILKGSPVKPDEIKWTGLDDLIEQARRENRPLTKAEVLEHLDQNNVQVKEVVKGGVDRAAEWDAENALRGALREKGWNPAEIDQMISHPLNYTGSDERIMQLGDDLINVRGSLLSGQQTKFDQYQLPGGENYRELLLTLPNKPLPFDDWVYETQGRESSGFNSAALDRLRQSYEKDPTIRTGNEFKSTHWDEPNTLAHIRFNERTDVDGKRVLFIEEVQSDWHQEGRRKGYRNVGAPTFRIEPLPDTDNFFRVVAIPANGGPPIEWSTERLSRREAVRMIQDAKDNAIGVPDAPFKETTNWSALSMKRVLQWAAENGFDRVGWTRGDVHTGRWGTERIAWKRDGSGYRVDIEPQVGGVANGIDLQQEAVARGLVRPEHAVPVDSQASLEQALNRSHVENAEGIAEKIWKRMQAEPEGVSMPRKEGMQGFYDTILPNVMNKLGKKFGARVGETQIDVTTNNARRLEPFEGTDLYGREVWGILDTEGDPIDQYSFSTRQEAEAQIRQLQAAGSELPAEIATVHAIDITPAMKQSVLQEGQPLFSIGAGLGADATNPDNYDEDGNYKPDPMRALATSGLILGALKAHKATLNNSNPAIRAVARMYHEPEVTGPKAGLSERLEKARVDFVRAWTDRGVDLAKAQQRVAEQSGRPLPGNMLVSEISRLNPDRSAEINIQNGIRPVIQDIGEDYPWLLQVLTHESNIDVARAMGLRAQNDVLSGDARPLGAAMQIDYRRAQAAHQKLVDELESLPQTNPDLERLKLSHREIERSQRALDENLARMDRSKAHDELVAKVDAMPDGNVDPKRVREIERAIKENDRQLARQNLSKAQQDSLTDQNLALKDERQKLLDEQRKADDKRAAQRDVEKSARQIGEIEDRQGLQDQHQGLIDRRDALQSEVDANEYRANLEREVNASAGKLQTMEKHIQETEVAHEQELRHRAVEKRFETEAFRKFSGGLNVSDSEAALADIQSQLPPEQYKKVQDSAQKLWDFSDQLRERMVKSGVWSRELADDLKAQYPHYTPTVILDYLKDGGEGVALGKSLSVRDNGLKKLTLAGTERAREDPVASLVRAAVDNERLARRNETFNAFRKVAQQDPQLAALIHEIPDTSESALRGLSSDEKNAVHAEANAAREMLKHKDYTSLTGYVDGKRVDYVVPVALDHLIKGEPSMLIKGAPGEMLNAFTGVFRAAATSRNPAFLAGNATLDAAAYTLREASRAGGPGLLGYRVPGILGDLFAAYAESFKGIYDGTYHGDAARYLKEGGGMFGFFQRDTADVKQLVDEIRKPHVFVIESKADLLRMTKDLLLLKPVETIGERIELAPRVAAFRRAERAGKGTTRAVIAGRDVTIDFGQGGDVSKLINQFVPFFNVGVQGTAQWARMFKENKVGLAYTAAGLVGMPAIAAEAWNRSDPQRSSDYDDVPDYVKYGSVLVMLPGEAPTDAQGNRRPQYFYIRLREFAPIAMLAREAASRVMKSADPHSWQELLTAGAANLTPVSNPSNLLLPGVSTAVEIQQNRDFYRRRDIATDRNDEQASAASKWLAEKLTGLAQAASANKGAEIRPSQVEYFIRDFLSGAGGMPLAASDLVTGNNQTDSNEPQRKPVIGGLLNRFQGGQVGQKLQNAQSFEQMVPESVLDVFSEAGLRPQSIVTPVGRMAKGVPLNLEQQTQWQEITNSMLELEVAKASRNSAFRTKPAEQEKILRDAVSAAKEKAATEVLRQIPQYEQRRLKQEAAAQGR